jgi:hypothetical protein
MLFNNVPSVILDQLAHYVQANCKDDMTIFLSSYGDDHQPLYRRSGLRVEHQ